MSTIATTSAATQALEEFMIDVNVSTTQRVECLKIVQLVLKNINDPEKRNDPKYRQLRLQNPKIQQNLTQHASMMEYMLYIGFEVMLEDNERFLRMNIPDVDLSDAYAEITSALERVHKFMLKHSSSSNSSTSSTTMTEKQKARLLAEEKKRKEREEEKAARKRTEEQIQKDKLVRQNDPNWKSEVSAAASKAGTSMPTFRDRFGE